MKLRLPFVKSALIICALAALSSVPVRASTFGINAHVPLDPIADEIVEAGIGWVRVDFVWLHIEPERDVYDWKRYDDLIDRLEARGLRIYAGFGSTPAWATSGSELSGVPDDPGQWQEFCYLVASRYRGRVDAWGMWNEPNSDRFWEGTRKQYIEMILLPGADAIRAADPGALVCAPDLAHLSSEHWDDWLSDVIKKAGHAIDVITHHIYPSYGTAAEVTYDLDQKLSLPFGSPSIRSLLKDTGWWGRPFWLTETGIESARYGEDAQAEYYEDLLDYWFGPHPGARWMDRIFFYHMFDGKNSTTNSFGIIENWPDLERKAAFHAYQYFISEAEVDDAEITAHTFPTFVESNNVSEILVTIRNTGNTTWSAAAGYLLDFDAVIPGWDLDADPIADGIEVAPGEMLDLWVQLRTAPVPAGRHSMPVTVGARMVNGEGSRFGNSLQAKMMHTDLSPPVVSTQPRGAAVRAGQRTYFKVAVESKSPVHYRWLRNSVELKDGNGIVGSNTRRLRIDSIDRYKVGDYSCIITNDGGSVATRPARLTLVDATSRRPSGRVGPPLDGTITGAR
jgi:hypothetical protein